MGLSMDGSSQQLPSGADLLRQCNTAVVTAHREGRPEEALEILDAMVRAVPDAAVIHNNRAVILAELGRDGAARPAFARALELEPAHVDANIGLGALLWRAGDIPAAPACYRIAAERDPQRFDAHLAI